MVDPSVPAQSIEQRSDLGTGDAAIYAYWMAQEAAAEKEERKWIKRGREIVIILTCMEHQMPAGTPVQVRLPSEEREALDTYRREQHNPPSRAQALRDLARRALRDHGCLPDGEEERGEIKTEISKAHDKSEQSRLDREARSTARPIKRPKTK